MLIVISNYIGEINMSDPTKSVAELWTDLKALVESLEVEVAKNAEKGNVSAGVRLRKGVRDLRKLGAELIKVTTAGDKALKEARKEKNKAKAAESASEPTSA